MMTRLDTISAELTAAFAGSDRRTRAAALHFACSHAADENELGGEEVDGALEAILAGADDPVLSQRMAELSQGFEDRYFELTDEEQQSPLLPGALSSFQKARVASALAFGLSGEQNASEALYEAISASSERDSLVNDLLKML